MIVIIYFVNPTLETMSPVINECSKLDREKYKLQNNKLSSTVR